MAFGFPAYAVGRFRPGGDEETIVGAVETALTRLRWPFLSFDGVDWQVDLGINWSSWGEKITITLTANNTLHVRSQCSFPLQCIDWGRNQRNVDKFIEAVDRCMPAP